MRAWPTKAMDQDHSTTADKGHLQVSLWPSSKRRFAVVDAVPTPTPTPLLDAIRARAEICVLRTTLSAEMACGVCAANVRCLELERVCMRIDLVLSSSIDHTVSFYDDSGVLTPSLFSTAPLTVLP